MKTAIAWLILIILTLAGLALVVWAMWDDFILKLESLGFVAGIGIAMFGLVCLLIWAIETITERNN